MNPGTVTNVSIRARAVGAVWALCLLVATTAAAQAPAMPAPPGRISGTVVDHRTETPLARVLVRLADTEHATTTGADGRFELAGVAAGDYTLTASVVGYAIVRRQVSLPPGGALAFTVVLTPGTGTYEERVDVVAPTFEASNPGAVTEQTLTGSELQDLRGMTADDPMRAVQALPGVTANDDFSAEFSARGAGPRNTNVILDGIPAAAVLLHSVEGRDDTGSIARISTDVLARASLLLGSYPQRVGDRLGPQLEFVSREGSRDGFHLRALASTLAAGAVAEGPMAGGRGSWLAAIRQSYLDWVLRRIDPDTTSWLGFTDGFAKVVFDVSPKHQLWLSALGGRAHYSEDGATGTNSLHDAFNKGGMVTAGLRSTGTSWVLNQRVFALKNRFQNRRQDGSELGWGRRGDGGYRGEFTRVWSSTLTTELGGHVQRTSEQLHLWVLDRRVPPRRTAEEDFGVAVTHAGAFAQLTWQPSSRTAVTAGSRVDTTGAVGGGTASPWAQIARKLPFGLNARAAAGLYHQVPTFEQIYGAHGGQNALVPQVAWHADAVVEQLLGAHTRWQVALFDREERKVTWASGLEPRAPGAPVKYNPQALYESRLEGYARGLEVVVQRRNPNGLSGWVAYAWARSHYTDPISGESFDGDYDQRHTLNAYASLRLWSRTTVVGRYRVGSNLPVRGYYQGTGQTDQDGLPVFAAGPQRNVAQLPDYSRLDFRINHAFNFSTRRMTLFLELINVLNRTNVGSAGGRHVEKLLPFIPAAGLLIEF